MDKATVTTLAWSLFALLLVIFWLPAILAKLGATRFLYLGPSPAPDPDPLEREPDYEFWAAQLRPLGYDLVGDVRLRMDFAGHHWRIDSWHRLLYAPSKLTYALIQKFPEPFNVWRGVEFVTVLSDDGLVATRNLPPNLYPTDHDLVLQGEESFDLAALETVHLTTLAELSRQGRRPDPEPSAEQLLRSMHRLEEQTARPESNRLAGTFLSVNFILHVVVSIPLAYAVDVGNWMLALTNIVLIFVLQTGEALQSRQRATVVREVLRQHLRRR